jgi:hypothetical protein
MSWEDHPEYGGPEPTWWGIAGMALVFFGLLALTVIFAISR